MEGNRAARDLQVDEKIINTRISEERSMRSASSYHNDIFIGLRILMAELNSLHCDTREFVEVALMTLDSDSETSIDRAYA